MFRRRARGFSVAEVGALFQLARALAAVEPDPRYAPPAPPAVYRLPGGLEYVEGSDHADR